MPCEVPTEIPRFARPCSHAAGFPHPPAWAPKLRPTKGVMNTSACNGLASHTRMNRHKTAHREPSTDKFGFIVNLPDCLSGRVQSPCRLQTVAPEERATLFQFFTRYSAVRHARACTVSVGLCAPLVPITEAPSTPRFGDSCERPQ